VRRTYAIVLLVLLAAGGCNQQGKELAQFAGDWNLSYTKRVFEEVTISMLSGKKIVLQGPRRVVFHDILSTPPQPPFFGAGAIPVELDLRFEPGVKQYLFNFKNGFDGIEELPLTSEAGKSFKGSGQYKDSGLGPIPVEVEIRMLESGSMWKIVAPSKIPTADKKGLQPVRSYIFEFTRPAKPAAS
jgi:hypothetical protein